MKYDKLLFLALLIMSFSFVMASPSLGFSWNTEKIREDFSSIPLIISDYVQTVTKFFFETTSLDPLIFVRAYYLVILFLVFAAILGSFHQFSGKKVMRRLIALSISIISVIFMPESFLQLILPSHFALWSSVISMIAVGILVSLLINTESLLVARSISIIFTVIFAVLFLGEGIESIYSPEKLLGIGYLLGFSVFLLLSIFLRNIRRWFFNAQAEEDANLVEMGRQIEGTWINSIIGMAKSASRGLNKNK